MSPDAFAFLHISGALVAMAGGFFALFARKGGSFHRRGGTVFAYTIMLMLGSGVVMAVIALANATVMTPHLEFQRINMTGAIIAFYLVATSLLTVRRPARGARWLDLAATLVAIAAAAFMYKTAFDALMSPKGKLLGFPALPTLIFGTITLLAIVGDLRIRLGRSLAPAQRIARHLWRMSLAMLLVTGSFFIGQSHTFPEWLRVYPLLAVPPLAVLALMLYWWGRMLVAKRTPGARRRVASPIGAELTA